MDELDLGATIRGFSAGQRIFNRYTLQRQLGRGGMGVVWLARDQELGRDTALKFLPEVVATDRAAIADMKREVRRAIDLAHPHIVKIHDFVTDGHMAAVSMEYVAGDTLSALRVDQPNQLFTAAQLAPWVAQLCAALEYAHETGEVVHRDLKPVNLMVNQRGDLKVLDFGIAASLSESVTRVSKQAGSSGTPVYMSPQQMMGGDPAVTDDIYALGATLYELLTGKPPFFAGNILLQVQNKVPALVNERRKVTGPDAEPVPASWEETIAACLAKEPLDRPQSAGEVATRLGLVTGLPAGAATTKRTKSGKTAGGEQSAPKTRAGTKDSAPEVKSSSKASLFVSIVAGVILLAGLGYYFGVYGPQQQRLAAEQARLAEIKRLENEGKAADAARLRTEQEKQDALAREQALRLANARGGLVIRTTPAGAEVRVGAIALDKSPLTLKDQKLGKYPIKVRFDGYEDWSGEAEVKENEFADLDVALVRSTGTVAVTSEPAGLEAEIIPLGQGFGGLGGQKVSTPATLKLPTGAYEFTFRRAGWPEHKQKVEVARNQTLTATADFLPGGLELTSTPAGAEVWQDGRRIAATTPYRVPETTPGRYDFELRLKGYKPATTSVTVTARQIAREHARLEKQNFPGRGQPWENTLGQKFVPVPGTDVLFCIWETRVQDFEAFVRETNYDATAGAYTLDASGKYGQFNGSWRMPGFSLTGLHPVGCMSQGDAEAFCRWLTLKEAAEGLLRPDQYYRLPNDAEWDAAVGGTLFSWGTQWPPPHGAGNFADQSCSNHYPEQREIIEGYNDGFPDSAVVGSFEPNTFGIFDLGGNLWERVGDRPGGIRGASYLTSDKEKIIAPIHRQINANTTSDVKTANERRNVDIGFRVVVVVGSGRP